MTKRMHAWTHVFMRACREDGGGGKGREATIDTETQHTPYHATHAHLFRAKPEAKEIGCRHQRSVHSRHRAPMGQPDPCLNTTPWSSSSWCSLLRHLCHYIARSNSPILAQHASVVKSQADTTPSSPNLCMSHLPLPCLSDPAPSCDSCCFCATEASAPSCVRVQGSGFRV